MARQRTPYQHLQSIAGVTVVTLGLDGAACPLGHFYCAIARKALGLLPSVILAALQAWPAGAFDNHRLLECLLQMLVSFWPVILCVVRAV